MAWEYSDKKAEMDGRKCHIDQEIATHIWAQNFKARFFFF